MTDAEIIKALEYCVCNLYKCPECPYNNETVSKCSVKLKFDTINLINRQQAENERLNGVIKNFKATKERQKAEINRLNKAVYNYEACLESIEKIKAKAIKEFAERLKKHFNPDISYDIKQYIDNLVKEMAGEDK